MSNFYVACEFGADQGRLMLGTLERGKLTLGEAHRFQNQPIREKDSLQWDIPHLFEETLHGLSGLAAYDEPVESISCHSWASDYLLFESDGSLISPTYHQGGPGAEDGMKHVLAKVPWETIYAETGVQQMPGTTLSQLGAERSRRLGRASHLMPVADAFNYLLGGVARVEMSLASSTQLYNPLSGDWSERLCTALRLPRGLLPPVVRAGTELAALRPEIAKETGLTEARVVASCSHEMAAALVACPATEGENWAHLKLGPWVVLGTEMPQPFIHDQGRNLNFSNELGYGASVRFSKGVVGLWMVEECRRIWAQKDREVDSDLLTHLAGSSPPFESLINPADPRFLEPGDLPGKIQEFCKETGQPVPRKPGPITRCILESLALLYRKTLREMETLTGRQISRLYLLNGSANALLTHFVANALQIPVVVAPAETAAIGNVLVQALALGHIQSLAQAREIVRNSFKMQTIMPHALAWNAAYDRLAQFCAA